MGGLAAACDLARQGCAVTLLERAAEPGGKMRQVEADGRRIDAGPTVFTMRWVFEGLFGDAGARLEEHIGLRPADVLARHAWSATERLDLFADQAASADAIGAFAGAAEARGFLALCAEARRIYTTLEAPFLQAPLPTMVSLTRGIGRMQDLLALKPFQTMWTAIGQHMRDPRLRQLFGRYATYCGSSPFLAPATLMLVADVEQQGVWLPAGGMYAVAQAVADLAAGLGTTIRYGEQVAEILVRQGRAGGVRLASGEEVAADAVVLNADPQALAAGLFGREAARAVPRTAGAARSYSALTWTGVASTSGFPLHYHTVFFSGDYRAEFEALGRGAVPGGPTVYVCAQDRDAGAAPDGLERLLILINAPATGDHNEMTATEIDRCTTTTLSFLERCGLQIRPGPGGPAGLTPTTPTGFDRLFPATGGALYGPAVHGPMATFRRPGSRTAIPGLYLAGGATHPGAGVPMAALSGRLAASALMADLGSTRPSRTTATSGGMSTR